MMHRVITNLIDAQSYMPDGIPRKIRNDMLLTVLFLQLLSEAWHDDLARTDDARQAQCPQCPVMFDALCDFKTCLVAYRQLGSALLQTSAAVCTALTRLAEIQPNGILNGVLRPERFSRQGTYRAAFNDNTDLDDALSAISNIRVSGIRGGTTMHNVFSAALAQLRVGQDTLTTELAPLIAQLLHPQPSETIFAPDCGHGQLAIACVDAAASVCKTPRMTVVGWEAHPDKWALARMQLLLRGACVQHLQNTGCPAEPQHTAYDVGVVSVPATARRWQLGRAWFDLFQCAEGAPPPDSRMAPAWLAVSNMKPVTGRCALLVPLSVLSGEGGRGWRRHVVEHDLLEAVIRVPHMSRIERAGATLLILLSRQKRSKHVAFIQARQIDAGRGLHVENYHNNTILHTMKCFHEGTIDPHLFETDTALITANDFSFDYRAYF